MEKYRNGDVVRYYFGITVERLERKMVAFRFICQLIVTRYVYL